MSYSPKQTRMKTDRERDRSRTHRAKRATLTRKQQRNTKRAIHALGGTK